MGRYQDSEPLYRQALAIKETTPSTTDISRAISQCMFCCLFLSYDMYVHVIALQKLADCLISQFKLEEAQSLLRRSLRIVNDTTDHETNALGENVV